MTAAEARKIEYELRRLLGFVERVNGDATTKLENLIRYSLDEAAIEVKHAESPPVHVEPLDEAPPPPDCVRCRHPKVVHSITGVCLSVDCTCPDYQAPAT